jgi:hypothetical protein
VDNADEKRANAGVEVQQLVEMQKEMLEEVGKYPGIPNHVEMSFLQFSFESGRKQVAVFLSTAWMKKPLLAHKYTTGWETWQVLPKKTKAKKSGDKEMEDECGG